MAKPRKVVVRSVGERRALEILTRLKGIEDNIDRMARAIDRGTMGQLAQLAFKIGQRGPGPAKCYACDAPATGTRSFCEEGKADQPACARHANAEVVADG